VIVSYAHFILIPWPPPNRRYACDTHNRLPFTRPSSTVAPTTRGTTLRRP
jgi:hypothetical protein